MKKILINSICFVLIISSCVQKDKTCTNDFETNELQNIDVNNKLNSKFDWHSRSNFFDVKTKHIFLDLEVDFKNEIIHGVARHKIEHIKPSTEIIFDVKSLDILKVTLGKEEEELETSFTLRDKDSLLGQALCVSITPKTQFVNIYYNTTKNTEALDWLSPSKTDTKKHPFLYTQGQAILTRTWIPCQDTPGNRITYSATVKVPSELMAVMSSENNPKEKSKDGIYSFDMPKPIPVYLIALAVGYFEFEALSSRTGVYAEPSMLKKSVYELVDMEKMVQSAEKLYGKYRWGRYDVIILPPAFPFGGMENPVLTFATPTIIAGDRSLVALIAHELAHSWSGNLVTNATWNDFWLNEGFTVYFEERIMEEIYGKEISDMLSMIEFNELVEENESISKSNHPEDTHLKLDLKGREPDDGMTSIAYIKGAFFLKTIESVVGRKRFDKFLKSYFDKYAFQTLTTEDFLLYLNEELLIPEKVNFNIDEWVYSKGIPSNCVQLSSKRNTVVDSIVKQFTKDYDISKLNIKRNDWIYQEWARFLSKLPNDLSPNVMKELDDKFDFKNWGNSEIMEKWYLKSIKSGYKGSFPEIEKFLINVGRRKFLTPIYSELAKTKEGKKMALKIYEKARPNYHSVSFKTIDEILDFKVND